MRCAAFHGSRGILLHSPRSSPVVTARLSLHASRSSVRAKTGGMLSSSRRLVHVCASSGSNGAAAGGSNGAQQYDFDLFTIGAGSGGVRASRFAAQNFGARVAVCEMPFDPIASDKAGGAGGTCVLRGCVPKKLMVYGGEFAQAFRDSHGFGWDLQQPGLTWERLQENKKQELARLNGVYLKLLDGAGVRYLEGRGTIVDPHTVEVAGKRYTTKHILIATGGRPTKLQIEGAEHAIISDQVLELPELPKKMAIIGGGYIALEFAGIYNNYGTETHVLYRQNLECCRFAEVEQGEVSVGWHDGLAAYLPAEPLPLRGFDEEVRKFVAEQYKVAGLNIHATYSPSKIVKGPDGKLTLHAESKQGEKLALEGLDHVLMATGRAPNTRNLGLEEVGVKLGKKGEVVVDEFSRTTVDSISAVGDVTDRINLTPVALMEGMAFARNVFGGDSEAKPDYECVASAVFSGPPLCVVGLSEEEARDKYGDIDVYTSSFKPMKNTISGSQGRGFMKIVVDTGSDRVVGMHMVGPDSAEILQGFSAVIKMGITKKQLDTVVGIHPSSAEEFVTMRTPTRQIREKDKAAVAA